MKLATKDRIVLLSILPEQGDFVTMTLKNDLVSKVTLTQAEMKELNMVSQDGHIRWDKEKEVSKEIEFTDMEKKLIIERLEELDAKKSLTDDSFNLYKLFR